MKKKQPRRRPNQKIMRKPAWMTDKVCHPTKKSTLGRLRHFSNFVYNRKGDNEARNWLLLDKLLGRA